MWEFQQALLNDQSFDIFGVAESRLGHKVDDGLINVQGYYSALRQDRKLDGGILYVKKTLRLKYFINQILLSRVNP